jgi:hypothetical protein
MNTSFFSTWHFDPLMDADLAGAPVIHSKLKRQAEAGSRNAAFFVIRFRVINNGRAKRRMAGVVS